MSDAPDAWMPLWIGDYLRDTYDLTAEEHGAYLLLLMAMWGNDGTLPSDQERLRRLARVEAASWPSVWASLERRFFESDDGQITQRRLAEELHAAHEHRRVASERGKAGAAVTNAKRWGRSSDAQATLKRLPSDAQAVAQRSLGVSSSPSPSPEEISPSARDPSATEHHAPARANGYQLQQAWGVERAAILGGFPWNAPPDRDGRTETFAERLTVEEAEDVRATMRLALEHVRDGAPDWSDPRLSRDPAFGFGAWRSRFSALREELRGIAPRVAAPAPRTDDPGEVAKRKAAEANEMAKRRIAETQRELDRLNTCTFHRQPGNERPSSEPWPTCPACKRMGRKRARDGDSEPVALGDLVTGGLR